eukprot:CAMPEP_0114695412 /NCGR_PEP_ID=MMETSP0191-20121206/71335_1 /TAXON_ID=126664 /ORGANISM="Sorites sp." /LENGTH=249 /DNA_ID=CAMNT_0001991635 /DNA_START=469 /DNA_END=1218 /DNA_ORIENTATION=-
MKKNKETKTSPNGNNNNNNDDNSIVNDIINAMPGSGNNIKPDDIKINSKFDDTSSDSTDLSDDIDFDRFVDNVYNDDMNDLRRNKTIRKKDKHRRNSTSRKKSHGKHGAKGSINKPKPKSYVTNLTESKKDDLKNIDINDKIESNTIDVNKINTTPKPTKKPKFDLTNSDNKFYYINGGTNDDESNDSSLSNIDTDSIGKITPAKIELINVKPKQNTKRVSFANHNGSRNGNHNHINNPRESMTLVEIE